MLKVYIVVAGCAEQGVGYRLTVEMQDAVGALVVLGYKDQEAADAVASAYEEGIGLEDLIRKALKLAAGKKFS